MQEPSNVPIFPQNVVKLDVINLIWMQAIELGRTHPGGNKVAACTVVLDLYVIHITYVS